jgi:hypothetical protein
VGVAGEAVAAAVAGEAAVVTGGMGVIVGATGLAGEGSADKHCFGEVIERGE